MDEVLLRSFLRRLIYCLEKRLMRLHNFHLENSSTSNVTKVFMEFECLQQAIPRKRSLLQDRTESRTIGKLGPLKSVNQTRFKSTRLHHKAVVGQEVAAVRSYHNSLPSYKQATAIDKSGRHLLVCEKSSLQCGRKSSATDNSATCSLNSTEPQNKQITDIASQAQATQTCCSVCQQIQAVIDHTAPESKPVRMDIRIHSMDETNPPVKSRSSEDMIPKVAVCVSPQIQRLRRQHGLSCSVPTAINDGTLLSVSVGDLNTSDDSAGSSDGSWELRGAPTDNNHNSVKNTRGPTTSQNGTLPRGKNKKKQPLGGIAKWFMKGRKEPSPLTLDSSTLSKQDTKLINDNSLPKDVTSSLPNIDKSTSRREKDQVTSSLPNIAHLPKSRAGSLSKEQQGKLIPKQIRCLQREYDSTSCIPTHLTNGTKCQHQDTLPKTRSTSALQDYKELSGGYDSDSDSESDSDGTGYSSTSSSDSDTVRQIKLRQLKKRKNMHKKKTVLKL